jgi:TolB protein
MYRRNNSSRIPLKWVFYLVIGLLVETCCLGAGLLGWMATRGLSPSAIAKVGDNLPVSEEYSTSTSMPESVWTPTSEHGLASPVWTLPGVAPTLSPASSPIPPTLPAFEVPPPGKIVFTCFDNQFDQICVMQADGTKRQQLTFENATSFYPSLSNDGSVIVFSSNRDGNFEIYAMDTNGKNVIQLTRNIGNLYAPEISPKGNRVVFTAESGGLQSIWVMRLDGSNPHTLFDGSGSDIDPTWSPDASQVAFASATSGDTLLYIADLQKNKVYPVIREGLAIGGRSSWSSNGKWLAFYAGQPGDRNIYIVSPEGGGLTQLTFGGDNLGPSFSPDGEWVAFTSFRDGNNEIYILNLNTQQSYRLTSNLKSDWQPRWGP